MKRLLTAIALTATLVGCGPNDTAVVQDCHKIVKLMVPDAQFLTTLSYSEEGFWKERAVDYPNEPTKYAAELANAKGSPNRRHIGQATTIRRNQPVVVDFVCIYDGKAITTANVFLNVNDTTNAGSSNWDPNYFYVYRRDPQSGAVTISSK